VTGVCMTFHAGAARCVFGVGEARSRNVDHPVALRASRIGNIRRRQKWEAVGASHVIDHFLQGKEFVFGTGRGAGIKMTIDALDAFVRTTGPRLVIRGHLVTRGSAEGRRVRRMCQRDEARPPGHSPDNDCKGNDERPHPSSTCCRGASGGRAGHASGRNDGEICLSAHAVIVSSAHQARMSTS